MMKPKYKVGQVVVFDNQFHSDVGEKVMSIGTVRAIHIHGYIFNYSLHIGYDIDGSNLLIGEDNIIGLEDE